MVRARYRRLGEAEYDTHDPVLGIMLGVGAVSAIGISFFLYWLSQRPPRAMP